MASIVSNFNTSGLTVGNTIIDSTGVISAPSITITGTTAPGPTSLVSKSYVDAITPAFTSITGKPTTLSGYGITDSVTAVTADSRYVLSGADSSSANFLSFGVNTLLTPAMSGKTIKATAAVTFTLPNATLGLSYEIYPYNFAVMITPQAGASIAMPDGSYTAAGVTYALPVGTFGSSCEFETMEGGSWRIKTVGRTLIANAVNNNEAVALGQANSRYAFSGADNTGANKKTLSTSYNMVTSDSGLFFDIWGIATNSVIGTPVSNPSGWNVLFSASSASGVTIKYNASGGGMFMPDGSAIGTGGSFTIPQNYPGSSYELREFAGSLYLRTSGRTIVANAVNSNEAVAKGQADGRYAPLGGAGTSGTWPIGISGNSATVTTLNSVQIFSAINNQSNPDWYRTSGTTGWFNSTYGVGLWSNSAGLVQTYNNASLQVNGALTVTGRAVVANAVNANEAVALGQFPASLAANGYQKLPNGLILQWGVYTALMVHGTIYSPVFPIAFQNAIYSVVQGIGYTVSATTTGIFAPLTAQSVTGFSFQYGAIDGGTYTTTVQWYAIGY